MRAMAPNSDSVSRSRSSKWRNFNNVVVSGALSQERSIPTAADCLAIVDGVFLPFIGKAETLLPNRHQQHPGRSNRWSPRAPAVLMDWRNRFFRRIPWGYTFQLAQKNNAPGLFLLGRIFPFKKLFYIIMLPVNSIPEL